jgi:hypothetical protein
VRDSTMSFLRRRWPFLIGGLVVFVAVAVFAVPYIYVHFINDPKPPLSFDQRDKDLAASSDATETSIPEPQS